MKTLDVGTTTFFIKAMVQQIHTDIREMVGKTHHDSGNGNHGTIARAMTMENPDAQSDSDGQDEACADDDDQTSGNMESDPCLKSLDLNFGSTFSHFTEFELAMTRVEEREPSITQAH